MAIGAITMILANVGLQIYNNWCGSRQNAALQQKREEFERAAKERNTEQMWRLMREGQELTLQLEKEKHADRLKELKDEVDHLLEKLTYETTISNWPLKVLPIVMKNQAFGNLLANQEENVAMHVIFTRSNYDKFNKLVFPVVEKQLEQYCDKHWSTITDHPILFYSGAWKPMVNPTDVQVTAMREELKNLSTLLITPFFRPDDGKLVFQLHMWGVGANSTDKFDVPEIEPTDFQRTFTNQDDYDNEEGLLEEIVEDLVPYLECMIGYMADTYFWSSAGLAPHLPLLLTSGAINTDGMKYLISDSREYYDGLLEESEEKAKENPFMQENLLNLCEGSAGLWEQKDIENKIDKILIDYCNRNDCHKYSTVEEIFDTYHFCKVDLYFIDSYLRICKNTLYTGKLKTIKNRLKSDNNKAFDKSVSLLSECDINKLKDLASKGNAVACYRLGEIYEYSIGIDNNPEESKKYYSQSNEFGFPLASIKLKIIEEKANISESDFVYLQGREITQFIILRALCLYKGYGVIQSVEKAMEELEKLSESTHPFAYYVAAKIVEEQYGEEQSELLINLLLKSSNLGYVQAQVDLMNIYYEGKFTKKEPHLCVEFAQKAALQAHPEALFTLAICLIRGYGTKCNKRKGIEILRLAAERGNNDAKEILNQYANESK